MNKRLLVGGVAIGLAVVIAAGGLYASNMGFKLNYPLDGAGVGGSKSGQNTLSLPFNPQVGINKASDLFFDIGTTAQLASVARLVESSDLLQIYKGTAIGGGPNFALTPGEAYVVNVKSGFFVNYQPSHY